MGATTKAGVIALFTLVATPALADCFSEAVRLGDQLNALETRLESMVRSRAGVAGACREARAAMPHVDRAETLLKTCPALGFVRNAKLVEISNARTRYKTQCL